MQAGFSEIGGKQVNTAKIGSGLKRIGKSREIGGTICPVGGQCLRGPVVYRAAVTANNSTEYYTGIAGNSFKERWDGHNTTLRHSEKRGETTLSQYIWDLTDSGTNFDLTWSIVQNAPIFNHSTQKCRLCNMEKLLIMFEPEGATLNSRSEFYSTHCKLLQLILARLDKLQGKAQPHSEEV